jgi:hypothetical protein
MEPIERNRFLVDFAKASPSINCLILNHSGSPERLQTNLSSIDLLCNKSAADAFIKYSVSYSSTRQVKVTDEFMRRCVEIEFADASEVRFYLIANMFRKGLKALAADEFTHGSGVNEYGMLTPSVFHHFEYILLKYQFAGVEFPDRYQKYFSSLEPAARSSVFRYLQGKYHFVFNTIEDLYKPKATARLKIMIGLRARAENSLIRMFFRTVAYFWYKATRMFFSKQKTYAVSGNIMIEKKSSDSSSRQATY